MAAADMPPPPARMLVNADEFRFFGSRRAGPSGLWRIQLRNNGEDDHDLAIRRSDGVPIARVPVASPGTVASIRVRLRPGRYTLFCTLAGHEALGMRWPLTVRTPAVRTTAR